MTTTTRTRIAAGACPECGFGIAVEGDTCRTACPQCKTTVTLTWVVGSHNEKVPCDDRCQYALKDRCSCSCGGDNHRAGYIKVDMVPAWVRKRDADRHAAKKARAAERVARVRRSKADVGAAQVAANPELTALLGDEYADLGFGFARDMRDRVAAGTPLTDGQLTAAVRMVQQDMARRVRQAENEAARAAQTAAALAAGVHCPTGRVTFTGEIATVKDQQGYVGRIEWKMLVTTAEGWKVWGTVPASLLPSSYTAEAFDAHIRAMRGRTVTITATVTPSPDDQLFGYMKRPIATYADQPAA